MEVFQRRCGAEIERSRAVKRVMNQDGKTKEKNENNMVEDKRASPPQSHSHAHPQQSPAHSSLTVGGGLVSPTDPSVATSLIFRPGRSVPLKQREELTAVLVQIVADGLRTFGARLGAHTVAADVIT